MKQRIPVMVVEDNRLLCGAMATILNRQPDLKVVAVAESVEAATVRARETRPSVVLCGCNDPARRHAGCVQSLKHAVPEARVIVTDLPPASGQIVEFVEAGASGFVVKDATIDEVVTTVRSVAAGQDVLPSALAGSLFSAIAEHASDRDVPGAITRAPITRREREIVGLIAEGLANKEIARRLNRSTYTIKSHVHNILEKLALHSRLQLAAHAHLARWQAEAPASLPAGSLRLRPMA